MSPTAIDLPRGEVILHPLKRGPSARVEPASTQPPQQRPPVFPLLSSLARALFPPPVLAVQTPVTAILVGAGLRGTRYASYAQHYPDLVIVGVAEPNPHRRAAFAEEYQLRDDHVFKDWKEILQHPQLADAVIVATLDNLHVEPTVNLSRLGYHVLLEKPMATRVEDCIELAEEVEKTGVVLGIGHVLRYSYFNLVVKKIVEGGYLGDIINIQHIEPFRLHSFVHSYVRGHWRNEKISTFALLAKSCHDVDLMHYFVGRKFARVSSFGSVRHFRQSQKPAAAKNVNRCLDCPLQDTCDFSAKRLYMNGNTGWPVNTVSSTPEDMESVAHALRTGPYGKCVWDTDNDAVDHQVVNMEFESNGEDQGAPTGTLTMVAMSTGTNRRKTRIFGSRLELEADEEAEEIRLTDLQTLQTMVIRPHEDFDLPEIDLMSGHGGGDYNLVRHFVEGVRAHKAGLSTEGYVPSVQETLASHIFVFAAEHSRKTGVVQSVDEYLREHSREESLEF
ncbi:hypothetical protein BOTBODRAFT_150136 [Botryobasidium botryosum FD-172 SS1]|uniref:Gfo/Idh/MocA-like oxidoreductase N-terminal domain-containing protein n=1 Tax=Botryobasidium botryosum (strain FD-172 SS1) TaxID=930990 RepID=A0A067N056_BOTB1|nr:hypothetical protein BOTBODRAFT_150136 [Botryobasidium botryosum FD-172 SS1]